MRTVRELLTSQLKKIPGIEQNIQPAHPGFISFQFKGKDFAHFDTDFELDVKLTKSIIAQERLEHPRNSTNHPGRYRNKPHWIVLPFSTKSDIEEILRLIKVALAQE